MKKIFLMLATFFGAGTLPKSPGTWGSLATLPFIYLLNLAGPLIYMAAVVIMLPVSVIAAEIFGREHNTQDDQRIVIDEVIGMMITMTWMPQTWQAFLAGFVLFRFFDILKPPPISYFDKRVKGGLGVVMDDVVAGIIASIIMQILYSQTNWLGAQNITFS
jgi:phosphatidylglycerophosphatase A